MRLDEPKLVEGHELDPIEEQLGGKRGELDHGNAAVIVKLEDGAGRARGDLLDWLEQLDLVV